MGLLLSGGGDPEVVVPLDEFFISQIDPRGTVLYIPIAMEAHVFTYEECFGWFGRTYEPYGITSFEMCTDLALVKDLDKYAAIFIGGGNTFKLMKAIRESRFDAKLVAYVNRGGFVYGGSAGAIIFGKTIQTATHCDVNRVGLTDLSGLDMAGGRDIWVHYSEKDDERIRQYENGLYILYEESGLWIQEGKVEGVGKGYLEHV